MATKLESPGLCLTCKSDLSRAEILKHLDGCGTGGGPSRWVIEVNGGGPYWLCLAADPESTFRQLDAILRKTWLECCGHMSQFEGGRIPMSGRLSSTIPPRAKFRYEYDFGTTTELELRVLGARPAPAVKAKVSVLARNKAPSYPCVACGKPGESICAECGCADILEGLVCGACARSHKCGEEMLLPLVNSPRTGMCGYTGD